MTRSIKKYQYLVIIAIGITLIATYLSLSRGLPGSFLIDDSIRIEGREIHDLDPGTLAHEIDVSGFGTFGRPVSLISLFITKYIHGNDPSAFKHENILLHLITGLLIFWLLYRLFKSPVLSSNPECIETNRLIYATLASVIWITHPLHVSTVLYAVQRMSILSALFTVATLLSYTIARQHDLTRTSAQIVIFALVPFFGLLAIFSKENAALLPLYLLLLEATAFRFQTTTSRERTALKATISIFVVIPLVAGGIYFFTHLGPLLHDYAARRFTLSERLGTEAVIMWKYVYFLLIPKLSAMSLYHDGIKILHFLSIEALVSTILWVAISIAAILVRKKEPVITLGLFLFLISHLMESTIFPLELMFEHRNYLGSLGLFLLVIHLLLKIGKYLDHGNMICSITFAIIASLLMFQTNIRADTWNNKEKLLLITLSDHPESDRAASALANLKFKQGQINKGRNILIRAINEPPHYALQGLETHLLSTYCLGDQLPPESLHDDVLSAIRNQPLSAYTMSSLSFFKELKISDQCNGIDTASIIQLMTSAGKNPNSRKTYRFQAYFLAGKMLTLEKDFQSAADAYENALKFEPDAPASWSLDALVKLGDIQIELGNYKNADETITRAETIIESSIVPFPSISVSLKNQRKFIHETNETSNRLETESVDD